MDQMIRCANARCRRLFVPNPRVKNQRFCPRGPCQRLRKSLWQKQKMLTDADYQANQRDCLARWRRENPDYWRRYRSRHPEYVQRNRLLQRERDRRRHDLAKMDASESDFHVKAGPYYLLPGRAHLAKMDALSHKVFLIPVTYRDLAKEDAMDFHRSFP
jgi:hypothetical protein